MVLLPEQGELTTTSFPELLLDLNRAGFSGWIELSRDRISKSFLFRDGIPMYAESNLTSESLGVQLMDTGEITRGDYSRVVERVETEGCKEGEALLELELIEPRGLFVALKDQVRKRLVECFCWTQGTFHVKPGDPPPEETQPFRTDLYALLQEGIAMHWSSERILSDFAEHMGLLAKRTALVPRIEPHLDADAETRAFIDALDGSRTLWKALRRATTARSLAAAWVLHSIAAIAYSEASESAVEADDSTELEIFFSDLADETERAEARLAEPSPGPAAAGPSSRLRAKIAELHERLDELDHYALLGVSTRGDANEFKRAYLAAAKDYHPDALARIQLDIELREQANKVFAAIGRAYAVLSNADRRRAYDASLANDGRGLDAEQIATAETLYRKGEILLRQGNFRGALEFLEPAVDIYPDEAAYRNALGWALYKKHPSEPDRAREHLEAALRLTPGDATIHFRQSVVLRALGKTQQSAASATKTRLPNPKKN